MRCHAHPRMRDLASQGKSNLNRCRASTSRAIDLEAMGLIIAVISHALAQPKRPPFNAALACGHAPQKFTPNRKAAYRQVEGRIVGETDPNRSTRDER